MLTSKLTLFGLGALCAFAVVAVHAQRGGGGASTLTVEDRLEIAELLDRYAFILDSCPDHNNGYGFADLFTPDGGFPVINAFGREAVALVGGRTPDGGCTPSRQRGPQNQIQVPVGHIIEATPEGAKGVSQVLEVTGGDLHWAGWYNDVYVKTSRGWRFKTRSHITGSQAGIPPDILAAQQAARLAAAKRPPNAEPVFKDALKWLAER
jgi:hypothetical protein